MKKFFKTFITLMLCVCMLIPNAAYVSAAKLGQVKKLKASETTATTITLKWNKVSGAESYQIYRYNTSSKSWSKIKTTSKTSYKVASLSTATTYQFKVRAKKGSQTGKYSSVLKASTKPNKVKNLKISSVTTNSLKLSWSAVSKAKGYQIYAYNSSTHKWTNIKTTSSKSYTVKSLASGGYYSYKVRAYYKVGDKKIYGSFSSSAGTMTKPGKVGGLKCVDATETGYTLQWNKVNGADKYYIYRLNGNTWKYYGSTSKTDLIISDISAKKVSYRVRAVAILGDQKFYGSYSNVVTAQSKKTSNTNPDTPTTKNDPDAPKNLKLKADPNAKKIKISWDAVKGVSGYQVYRYNAANGQWTRIITTTATSCTYSVDETGVYTFKVRSYVTKDSKKYYSSFTPQTDVYYKSNTQSSNDTISQLEKSGILGYLYDPVNKCFYTSSDPWQRNFGFSPIYDACAPFTIMFYNTKRMKFYYGGLDWMIQIWKGQYGWVFIGAEMGVYTKDPKFNVAGFYACASDENLLNMSMVLYHKDKVIVNRPYGAYWWCTGFVPGVLPSAILGAPAGKINTDSLTLVGRITLKNETMAVAFVKALEENGFVYGKTYIKSGADVIFTWK